MYAGVRNDTRPHMPFWAAWGLRNSKNPVMSLPHLNICNLPAAIVKFFASGMGIVLSGTTLTCRLCKKCGIDDRWLVLGKAPQLADMQHRFPSYILPCKQKGQ
jgi:hypothetical protein